MSDRSELSPFHEPSNELMGLIRGDGEEYSRIILGTLSSQPGLMRLQYVGQLTDRMRHLVAGEVAASQNVLGYAKQRLLRTALAGIYGGEVGDFPPNGFIERSKLASRLEGIYGPLPRFLEPPESLTPDSQLRAGMYANLHRLVEVERQFGEQVHTLTPRIPEIVGMVNAQKSIHNFISEFIPS